VLELDQRVKLEKKWISRHPKVLWWLETLQLIYSDQPLVFLKLVMAFLYNLIATSLNLKGTFSFSNLFHKLFLGTVSKSFLKSKKQQKRLDLVLMHSYPMILSVMRWSMVEWYLIKLAWPLALLPWLSCHMLILFSRIIPYYLAKRGLIIIVL